MRIPGFSIFLVALVLLGSTSCATPAPQIESQPGTFELRLGEALVWEVSRPGSTAVSAYLLGSVHLLDQPLSLGQGVERAFEDANALVVEVDLRDLEPKDLQDLVIRHGMLTWGEKLADFLTPETLVALDDYFDEHKVAPDSKAALSQMRPWLIAATLVELSAAAAGYRADLGVDQYFLSRAGDKPVIGLETLDEQFFTLSSYSDDVQEMMLVQAIEGVGEGEGGEIAGMIDAWKAGDEVAFTDIIYADQDEVEEMEEFYETLLLARNELMAETLLENMQDRTDDVFFVVVGCAHLVGDQSINTLLRDAGYRVERARR